MIRRLFGFLVTVSVLLVPARALAGGQVQLYAVSHGVNNDGSAYFTMRMENPGDMPVYGIEFEDLAVYDVNGQLLARSSFSGPPLSQVRLRNGEAINWTFIYHPADVLRPVPTGGKVMVKVEWRSAFYNSPDILLNGEVLEPIDVPAILKSTDNRTYLPIRSVAQALGASVEWNAAEQKVTLVRGDTSVDFWIGRQAYAVNGAEYPMDAAPMLYQDRTMVPVRYAAEALGMTVAFDGRVLLSD